MSEERPTGREEADPVAGPGAAGREPPAVDPPDGPPPPGDGAPPEPAGPPRCEVCGAELEPDQTYCLECGSPTPLAPRLRRGGRGVALLAGAIALLGVGAGALAYAVATDDDGGGTTTASTLTATGPFTPLPPSAPTTGGLPPDTSFTTPTMPTVPGQPTTPGFPTVTGPPATGPTAPTTDDVPEPQPEPRPQPGPEPDPGDGASDWPPGRAAWTAVLSSVRDEADARAAKARVRDGGDEAGVLWSSDFTGLRPGYWVVFSGVYDDRGAAVGQASRLRPEFPGAYARRISG
ncbi:SPOR domain-containing protein [Miltoncostaea marina]|uniref:SPOR domain-containing protein n=1 Tax=Miltoncostaea marina TaxID=2843215 RepID=UPI001C3D2FE2|nr:SPOR domain-containing protein [Miltoncostaea marina]